MPTITGPNGETLYMATLWITQADYEATRQKEYPVSNVYLEGWNDDDGTPFNEADIGQIVKAIAQAENMEVPNKWEAWAFGHWALPFEMKVGILEVAAQGYEPGNVYETNWQGDEETTQEFLTRFAELFQFDKDAETIGREWLERTSPQTQHGPKA